MPLRRNPCNLYELSRAAIQPFEALAGKRSVTVARPDSPITAVCDIDLIRRVVANLVGNAIKYTDDDGTITIQISAVATGHKVAVSDNGPGIPRELHQRVFEKFGQIKAEQRSLGVGLGLTFCKLAVEAHGGAVGLESEVGKGSTFWFTLPLPPTGNAPPPTGTA
jgi:signal transduction histidine kinase